MAVAWENWPTGILDTLRRGTVIPAHLLASDPSRKLDVRRQRALSRYYIDAGAGGLAVGVHSTQFAIREVGMYEDVLCLAPKPPIIGQSGRSSSLPGLWGEPRRPSAKPRSQLISAIMPGS